tara:strand:+ start:7426 stop:8571 length:1146 start_codon:yes stop_codon:yes gene_type:complete
MDLRPRKTQKKQKGMSAAEAKRFAKTVIGDEPVWEKDSPRGRVAIMTTYNWYDFFHTAEDAVGFLVDFLVTSEKYDKRAVKVLKTGKYIPNHFGWKARMQTMGYKFDTPEDKDTWLAKVDALIAERTTGDVKETANDESVKPNIQTRIKAQVDDAIGNLEVEFDSFMTAGYASEFDPNAWFVANGMKANQSRQVGEFFAAILQEVTDAKENPDQDLKDGFKHVGKKNLGKSIKFLTSIVDAANVNATRQKVTRKTRVKKPKSVVEQAENIKYKVEDPTFNLVSQRPLDIIGASQLWVFNTKYRTLGAYVAYEGGFKVKGTTLKNWKEGAYAKTIRKPDITLPQVLKAGKVALKKILPGIKAKEKPMNGRINKETILLRIVK